MTGSLHKIKIIALLTTGALLSVWLITSCNKSTELAELHLSVESFEDVPQNGDNLRIVVESSGEFEATSSVKWLAPNITHGASRNIVTIKVSANLTGAERTGKVIFTTPGKSASVQVTQKGGEIKLDEVEYEINVIFHILYNEDDANNPDEEKRVHVVNSAELQRLLEDVNRLYAGQFTPKNNVDASSPDQVVRHNSNVRFVLATHDPEGNLLSPSGIQKTAIPEKNIDPSVVMGDKTGGMYHDMAWPLTEYINIFIFPFSPMEGTDGDEFVTLGIAHFPYTVSSHPLEGLSNYDRRAESFDNYNHCIVINLEQAQERFYAYSSHGKNLLTVTIAHELGHYLGLAHPYAEEVIDNVTQAVDNCLDSDYCEDTPSYNRIAYWEGALNILSSTNNSPQSLLEGLLQRTDCSGKRFTSTNVMDYEFSYNDRFTPGQIERMRHTLYYSYTVPGDKAFGDNTRAVKSVEGPEPTVAICTLDNFKESE
ncbi:MAG: zinc-dependent metalloproteinase lipoprotein [Porphyromonas sp.]|nr:zinc-dependent metalloproteinase lipoprotein [Porphyromonas sp.]